MAIALGSVVLQPLVAGMLVSLVAGLAAAVGLHRLVRLDDSRPAARAAVVAMAIFPTAFAFIAPYSESLFVALSIWAFVRAREASTGRALGFWALWRRSPGSRASSCCRPWPSSSWLARRRLDRQVVWVAFISVGLLAYLLVNYATFGDPLYFVGVQRDVFRVVNIAPWDALGSLWHAVLTAKLDESWVTIYLAPLVAFVVLGLTVVWTVASKHSRASYAVYTVLNLVAFASLSWPISVPRYLLGVFPVFLAMGVLLRRPIGPAVGAASALLLGLFVTLFASGHWAF